jgi:ligand-binding sensor domain-containing protein
LQAHFQLSYTKKEYPISKALFFVPETKLDFARVVEETMLLFSSQSQSRPTTSTDSNKLNYFLDMIKHTRLQADRQRKKERKKEKKREKKFLDKNYFVMDIQSFKAALLLLLLLH